MREEHYWPEWDSDFTADRAAPERLPAADPLPDHDDELADELLQPASPRRLPVTRGKRVRRGLGRALMIAGGAVAVFVLLYLADLLASIGDVPRGVRVAGVEVGGLSREEAEALLRRELEPRLVEPLTVHAGDVRVELDPRQAGLGLDWAATVAEAGSQPLDPLTRLRSFFTDREVGVVSTADDQRLRAALGALATAEIDHQITEGTIGFQQLDGDEVRPYAIPPRQGQRLVDVDGAVSTVKRQWLLARTVEIPVDVTPPKVTLEGVQAALRQTRPLVSGPVTVRGEGKSVVLQPRRISEALRYTPDADGQLRLTVDPAPLVRVVQPELAATERDPRNARIGFAGDMVSMEPSQQGRVIDWESTFAPLLRVAARPEGRELPVTYDRQEPEVTTEDARALGITEVIGEFTTSGLFDAAAHNVATMAAAVDGAVVRSGETFSLDRRTGPRTESQDYVVAPLHEDGTGAPVIGGGVSQFTTTLYNAAYFAGLTDAGHLAHTHYLDRYPPARDAISLRDDGSSVDLAFTNDLAKGVAIQAEVSGDLVTVRIWGTRQFGVGSSTSDRAGQEPPPVEADSGPDCVPEDGTYGFTVSDTRVLYDVSSGREVRRESHEVTYAPRPTVFCSPESG
ncbi:VanW family protein [Saccharomonospora sp. NPDC046836]|uniref:VanW family protein n=1 Tax=Saccharomonospora sp. NPDC046836 TaxID=3156921 RepID=UPI00340AA705